MSNDHGLGVINFLTWFAGNPEYHFFRAIGPDGEFADRHLMIAVERARKLGEVDVINLSAGLDHISDPDKDCSSTGPTCAACEVVSRAVADGITIVAGIGNLPDTEGLCCPALADDVIGVGGMIAKCTAKLEEGSPLRLPGESVRPPNAFWVDRDDDRNQDGSYCSNRGCLPGESCSDNRKIEPWPNNPPDANGKPDTLAPLIVPMDDDGPLLVGGTSYATPIVTGSIADVLGGLRGNGGNPSPSEIRKQIRRASKAIPGSDAGVFSGDNLAGGLGRRLGLEYEKTEPNTIYRNH